MIDPSSPLLLSIILAAVPVLLAITVHEAAHAYAAKMRGDTTAQSMGRLTLNPIKHIDPLGTIAVPALCLVLGGFMFGWAKPVPFNPSRLMYPRKDIFIVAIAGPVSNLLMAFIWYALLLGAVPLAPENISVYLASACRIGIQINLILMIFNLLPIPPLDGAKMLARFLNSEWRWRMDSMEKYGLFIVLGLSFTGILGALWINPWMSLFSWMR